MSLQVAALLDLLVVVDSFCVLILALRLQHILVQVLAGLQELVDLLVVLYLLHLFIDFAEGHRLLEQEEPESGRLLVEKVQFDPG